MRQDFMAAEFTSILDPEPGRALALCREHPEVDFHPTDGRGVIIAQRICQECPVRTDCLAFSLTHEEYGVWGGESEKSRRRMRSRNRRL